VLSVGEERDGFTGIFEVVAADKARGGSDEKETPLRGERRLPPLSTLRDPCCPNQPSHPCLTQRANWGRERDLNHRAGQLTTQRAMI